MGTFREKIQRFMYGRYGTYGTDKLNSFLMIGSLILLICSWFFGRLFFWVAIVFLGYAYFRMFSKNYAKRYAENEKFLKSTYGIRGIFARYKKMWSQRKTHKFYKCPTCKQQIRVPKGHGRIQITCPKCRTNFEKTT